MKTKIKKILSVALPIISLDAVLSITTPFIVSCSNGSESEKPQEPTTPGGGDNGGSTTQTIKATPKNKYTSWEAAKNRITMNRIDDFESNGWISSEIFGSGNSAYDLISPYIAIKSIDTQIVDPLNRVATSTPQAITDTLNVNKTWDEFSKGESVFK